MELKFRYIYVLNNSDDLFFVNDNRFYKINNLRIISKTKFWKVVKKSSETVHKNNRN